MVRTKDWPSPGMRVLLRMESIVDLQIGSATTSSATVPECCRVEIVCVRLQTRVLGPDHPNTLNTRHNLASVLDHQGGYEQAKTEYQQVLDMQMRVLGPDHPDTLSTRHGLASVLDDQGC